MGQKKDNKIWDLVVGKVNKSLDEEENIQFRAIEKTEEGQQALEHARQIYSKSLNSFLYKKIDKKKNWEYINSQISPKVSLKNIFIPYFKYAAIFIVALTTGLLFSKMFNDKANVVTYNSIEMDLGQKGKMVLSDGTEVWINAGTTIKYPTTFDKEKRSVILDGEAQFKVTHNSKIPFEVVTETGIIEVHGTTFNVSSYKSDPELVVTLIEGKVSVVNKKGDIMATLNPSEQLRINKLSGETNLIAVDTKFYNSWVEGKMLLDGTELSQLIPMLERCYNVDVRLIGDDAGDIKVSGTIVCEKPLDMFLKVLERMHGIRYEYKSNINKKDEVIIYK